MSSEDDLQRARPDVMEHVASDLRRLGGTLGDASAHAGRASREFADGGRGMTVLATAGSVQSLAATLQTRSDEVRQAASAVHSYAGDVARLRLRLVAVQAEVTATESAYARQGSLHSAALDVYEVALGAGAGLLGAVGIDGPAEELRGRQRCLEAAEQARDDARRRLRALLEEYERRTAELVGQLLAVDLVYAFVRRSLGDPGWLDGSGRALPDWQDRGQEPLFGDDDLPDVGDVSQGQVGDCYFLAAVLAVLASPGGPERLRDMVEQNPDGTFTVRFADGDVTVDGDLPGAAAHTDGGRGLWVAVLEKAYAQRGKSYGDIEGGWPDDVLRDQFGYDTRSHRPPSDRDVARLADAVADGRPGTIALDLHDLDSGFSKGSLHALTVLSTYADGRGQRRFQIANPWGSSGSTGRLPSGVTVDYAGRFWVSASDLKGIAREVAY